MAAPHVSGPCRDPAFGLHRLRQPHRSWVTWVACQLALEELLEPLPSAGTNVGGSHWWPGRPSLPTPLLSAHSYEHKVLYGALVCSPQTSLRYGWLPTGCPPFGYCEDPRLTSNSPGRLGDILIKDTIDHEPYSNWKRCDTSSWRLVIPSIRHQCRLPIVI